MNITPEDKKQFKHGMNVAKPKKILQLQNNI